MQRSIWFSTILIMIFACGTALFVPNAVALASGFKTFNNSIVSLPPEAKKGPSPLVAEASAQELLLHFSLETPNKAQLAKRVAAGQIIPPSELLSAYGGNKASHDTLVSWLSKNGFTIVGSSKDFSDVYAKAPATRVQTALHVSMTTISLGGRTYVTATTAPQLPIDVGAHVVAIDGLQPFLRAQKQSISRDQYYRRNAPSHLTIVPRPNAAASVPTYRVRDILTAYGAQNLGVTGRGQVIAILIDAEPKDADVRQFWSGNGLPASNRVKYVNVQGVGVTLPAPEGEETLDTEWASGIASGATVMVYASGSLEYPYLDLALDRIFADALSTPGERELSISLGLREDLVSSDERAAEQTKFEKLAALGVSTFVSSGDAGSNPDQTGHQRGPDAVVEYEASDPYVIAVGGTSLKFNPASGKVISEIGWSDSGGGVSGYFARPQWQVPATSFGAGKRLVPDVSAVADPIPGAYVILNGNEWPVGGTSWSAPIWAGFAALIAEARAKQNKPPLPYLGKVIYSVPYGSGFRDITTGSNGAYSAGVGWDAVTGIGTPDLGQLILQLKNH